MANLSDEELLFLSNLMHMKEEGEFKNIWIERNSSRCIGFLESIYNGSGCNRSLFILEIVTKCNVYK